MIAFRGRFFFVFVFLCVAPSSLELSGGASRFAVTDCPGSEGELARVATRMWAGLAVALASANMIPGGYRIANPNPASPPYSTEFTSEFFDVYSLPIRSQYAEVFWRMMDPVPLDERIVARFANKTMAVVGYEVDQVRRTAAGDVPVPITHAYNHRPRGAVYRPYGSVW